MLNCIKHKHDPVFTVTWASFMIVGIGSFLFHSTLWYSMQLVDELSMINTTLVMWFATFTHRRSNAFSLIFGILLIAILGLVTGVYHYLGDPVFHQNVYTLLTVTVLARSWYLVHMEVKDVSPVDYKRMRDMVLMGLLSVGSAFTLWNLDTMYCSKLIQWRRQMGMPWGFLLEGHGLWHLLSGLSGYYYITYGVYLRHCLEKRQHEFEFIWPSKWTSLPYVARKPVITDKATNGSAVNGAGADKKTI